VITDEGCSGDSDPIQVTVNPNPVPVVNPIGATTFCQGGSVTLTTGSFASYLWSTGETTQSITVSASGSYTVTVTDGNGCEGTSAPITVTVNPLPTPTVSAGGPTTFCQGGSVTLTSSPAVSYLWSNGQTTQSITVSTAGSFSVTVTDGNGCQGTSVPVVTTINSNPTPTITADGPTTFCVGGSVTLTASSGSSFVWSTGATTQSITVSAAGSYTVTVTDANGCSGTSAAVNVTVNNNPNPTISTNGPTQFCDGGSVILTASSATSYLWSTGATTQSITVTTSGSYSVMVTNANGCSGTSAPTNVTVFSNPDPELTASGNTTFCQGGSVQLSVTLGNSYLWSTGATAQTITVNASGSYWATVTNINGCSGVSDTVDVVVNPNPTPTITADGPLEFCNGDSVTLTASAASAYLWSNGATTQSTTVYASGSYSVTVTDANGCNGTSTPVTVVVNELPFSFIFAAGPTTFCEGDSVDLVARESAGYLWSNGATTQIITVSTSGTYSVVNIDDNGCQQQSNEITVVVNQNPIVNVTASGPTTFCLGQNVTLTASVASPLSIDYDWSTNASTQSIVATQAGSYWVHVTDENGCEGQSDTVEVNTWDLPVPEIVTIGSPSFCAGDTIFLTTTQPFEAYLWTNGDTTQTTFALTTGIYNVLVTDTNGCQGDSPDNLITVNVNPTPTTTPDGVVEICQGDTITITSVPAESYLWTTGDTTQVIYVWQAGIYNVTATDQNGCTGTSSDVTLIVHGLPNPVITADNDLDFCQGEQVTLSTQQFDSYLWSTGATSQSITVSTSGTYTVTVTDSTGCAAVSTMADVTVYQNPNVSISINGPTQFCFGDSVILTASTAVSYLWSTGETTQSIVVYTSGSFNVTVTDLNGCVGTSPLVSIAVYSLPNIDIIANGPTEFCQSGSVTLTATGGQNYVWSTGATGNSITVSATGSYYVTGGNQFGCVDTSATVSVLVNNPPTVAIFPDGPTTFCEGGSVDLVASGADSYLWSTGVSGPVITVNATGLFSVVGTDANGCSTETSDISVTVNENPVPTITAGGPTEFCVGDSVVLTASVADEYQWSTGATTQSITVFTAGTYTVDVVDANGCEGTSAPVTVVTNSNPTPTISLSGPAQFCLGDSVVLSASMAEGYVWSTGDTTQSITVYTTGTFSVNVTDEFGCSGTSASVTTTAYQNPVPEITTASGDTVVCQGTTVTLTSSFASTYEWSTGANSQQITVTDGGLYSVTVTDANGCQGVDSIRITVNPIPTPIPVITPDGPTTFCDGDSVNLTVDVWETYFWSTGDTTQTITATTSGLYVVTVTNEFGCAADAAGIVVTVNPNPMPVIQATGDGALCAGESIILGTTLYNSYVWSTGDTTQLITVDSTGNYNVTVTNSFGCSETSADFEVVQNPLPVVSIQVDGPTTVCQGAEVSLTAVGNGPYLWSTGDTTQTITVSTGTYFVQATDTVTGCVGVSEDVVIDNYPPFNPEIEADGPTAFCEGDDVVLSVVDGVSFLWSTGDTTQSITVTETGVYTVEVVSADGCVGMAGENVTILPAPIAEIVPTDLPPYCDGDVVTLAALFNLGATYEWSTGETGLTIDVTTTGVYTVTVSNFFGCSAEASIPVGFLPTPNAQVIVDGPSSICEGDEVTLTAVGLPFINQYVWNTGETGQQITVSEAGMYSVTVTNPAGCSATSEPVQIDVVPGPEAVATVWPDSLFCVGETVTLEASGGDNYVWSNGATTSTITVIATQDAVYTVEVTNEGCGQVSTDDVAITVQQYPNAWFGYDNTDLGEPTLFTDSSTVQPMFSWNWDFGDGTGTSQTQNPTYEYHEEGEYSVTLIVSTSAGCSDTAVRVLDIEERFIITNVLTPNNDDINDYVWITSSLADAIEAKIYNRWGVSVWEGVGTDLRFSGKTSAGVDLPAGTYYYVIVLDYGDAGTREYTGYITLIRE